VEFIGTRAQWHAAVGENSSEQRRRFVKMHELILSVRVPVVMRWLQLLHRVNPLYADVVLPTQDQLPEIGRELESVTDMIINDARITENDVAVSLETHARSNVATGGVSGVMLSFTPASVLPSTAAALADLLDNDNEPVAARHIVDNELARLNLEMMNEYVRNDDVFLGGFPHLFLFGRQVPTTGPFPTNFVCHLLLQHDQRFSRTNDILFLLFNQLQRHGSARSVYGKILSNKFEAFVRLVATPGFRQQLYEALQNPETPEAKCLEARLRNMVRISGGSVPWSPTQRAQSEGQLMAYVRHFGPPAWFLTISPADMDSSVLLRLSAIGSDHTSGPPMIEELNFPPLHERLRRLAENPVAAALSYRQALNALFNDLLGLSGHTNVDELHQ
jgi:hypothetical protein